MPREAASFRVDHSWEPTERAAREGDNKRVGKPSRNALFGDFGSQILVHDVRTLDDEAHVVERRP